MNTALLLLAMLRQPHCALVYPDALGGTEIVWIGQDAPAICEGARRVFPVMYPTDRLPDTLVCVEDHTRRNGSRITHAVGVAFGPVPDGRSMPGCAGDGTAAW